LVGEDCFCFGEITRSEFGKAELVVLSADETPFPSEDTTFSEPSIFDGTRTQTELIGDVGEYGIEVIAGDEMPASLDNLNLIFGDSTFHNEFNMTGNNNVLIGNVALFNIELRAGVVGFEGEDINTVDNHDATAVLSGSAISRYYSGHHSQVCHRQKI